MTLPECDPKETFASQNNPQTVASEQTGLLNLVEDECFNNVNSSVVSLCKKDDDHILEDRVAEKASVTPRE